MTTEPRNYLTEARAIVAGTTLLLPERMHLQALEIAHAQEIIEICKDVSKKVKEINGLLQMGEVK